MLDPMAGSGTVLRIASELGHQCTGFDLDPLAVLMARVWTTPLDADVLKTRAREVAAAARHASAAELTWIRTCAETKAFVRFWFEKKQELELRKISRVLFKLRGKYADALRIALSRTIITKDRGASIARDTSHSRPHRIFFKNDYDVFRGFILSADRLADRLAAQRLVGRAQVKKGDARNLSSIRDGTIDAVVTSPPYLNAIDYLRGHRLSLVWLGHTLASLREIRSESIGTEVAKRDDLHSIESLVAPAGNLSRLPSRELGMINRYAGDVAALMKEIVRVLKKQGKAIVVVGDSRLCDVPISNAAIVAAAAKQAGLTKRHSLQRVLPDRRRYLPPPSRRAAESLSNRMRSETVLSFVK